VLKNALVLLTLTSIFSQSAFVWADSGATSVNEIVQLDQASPKHVQLSEPVDYLPSQLKVEISKHTDQSHEDFQNLSTLWQTIVVRNPVIQYSLKQLATPLEQRYVHESAMSRTVSGLLSGAALLPAALSADAYTTGFTSIGSSMVDKAIQNSKKQGNISQLPTDTELVELSSIVQHLEQSLVENYFAYKDSLNAYLRQDQLATALASQCQNQPATADPMNTLWLKHLYDTADMARLKAREDAMRHYLVLERMAGTKGMQNVHFEVPPTTVSAR